MLEVMLAAGSQATGFVVWNVCGTPVVNALHLLPRGSASVDSSHI